MPQKQFDVDVLAQFDDAKPISLIGLVHIENQLSDLLGRKVDFVQGALLETPYPDERRARGRACLLDIAFSP